MAKRNGNGGLFHSSGKGRTEGDTRKSSTMSVNVGSGSRPTRSKIPLEDSAPTDPYTLNRGVPGALK